MKAASALALAALACAPAALASPAEQARQGQALRFEREGYHGNIYFNADGSYVILQTSPQGVTEAFTGRWTPNGASGFCMRSGMTDAAKCFDTLPERVGERVAVRSSLDETYFVELLEGR